MLEAIAKAVLMMRGVDNGNFFWSDAFQRLTTPRMTDFPESE